MTKLSSLALALSLLASPTLAATTLTFDDLPCIEGYERKEDSTCAPTRQLLEETLAKIDALAAELGVSPKGQSVFSLQAEKDRRIAARLRADQIWWDNVLIWSVMGGMAIGSILLVFVAAILLGYLVRTFRWAARW